VRREELVELAQSIAQEEGFELVECTISRTNRSQTFRFAVDREAGVSIEDCARISRKIALVLDGNPLLHGAYQLEVASAGMNRPIWKREHYERFAGEPVVIQLADPEANPRTVQGSIGPLDEHGVWILSGRGDRRLLPLETIAKAQLRMDPWKRRAASQGAAEGDGQSRPSGSADRRPGRQGRVG
jgi:ribosome maturation factor RimP